MRKKAGVKEKGKQIETTPATALKRQKTLGKVYPDPI